MIKQYLETGKIVGTHGIKGMVRVQPWSDSGEFLTKFKYFYLDKNGGKKLKAIKAVPHGNVVIVAFEDIDTIEKAEAIRNTVIYINRNDIDLPEGRYFIDDLIGCHVYDAFTKEEYGIINDVSQTGANDVWHIKKDEKEYLLPAIDSVIASVDVKAEEVFITPMKGIFDDEN